MKKVVFTFLVSFFSIATSIAQATENGEVLFTIDGEPYYTNEFKRVYNKNLNLVKDDSQKDLDTYLDLYVGYKLKVKKAKDLGLQNNDAYLKELKSYRAQLAKSYMNDSKITEELVQEAYDRSTEEIRASHILVKLNENALPKDTLAAYNKIANLRRKVLSGANFDEVAEQYSEDPSAKSNKGDLGYFTSFKMVYPFETAAYKTPVGEVSEVFRTQFGYHFLKVTDRRKNRGEVEVRHIMLLNSENEQENADAKARIFELYQKIQQGESFEELAKQFSQDKTTASKGGLLPRFSSGQLTTQEFEDESFALKNEGDVSKPFTTKFGWHLVKLVNKIPLKTFEQSKTDFENKIKRDSRSTIIESSLHKKLRNRYSVSRNDKLYAQLAKLVDDSFYSQKWKKPNFSDKTKTLVTLNNVENISADEFLDFVEKQQKDPSNIAKPIANLVDLLYEKWVNTELTNYYNNNLENEYPDFHYIMEEYRDGLLLFDLMEKEIWDKAKNDSVSVEKFYLDHKEDYSWKKRYDIKLYSSTNKEVIEKTAKYLKQGKSAETIKSKLNTSDRINVVEKSGIFEEDYDVIPKLNITNSGITPILKEGTYYFVGDVIKILPVSVKPLDECRGKVVSDYQQFLEKNWVSNLEKEYDVEINTPVFEKVKAEIKP